mgnify:CR=1 FL=1
MDEIRILNHTCGSCAFCTGIFDTSRFDPSLTLIQNMIVSFVDENQPCTQEMVVDFITNIDVCEDCLNYHIRNGYPLGFEPYQP